MPLHSSSYNLTPVNTVATPNVKSSHGSLFGTVNPACSIILENLAWGGKRSIDSTRYWYESRSAAIRCPSVGITWKE
jgi:hypothetical protein